MQVLKNLSIYSGMSIHWDHAITYLEEGVSFCRLEHRESLDEVLSLLGYALISSGRIDQAIHVLLEAHDLLEESLSVDRLLEVKKMLVVAYDEIGNDELSDFWFEQIEELYPEVV